ncbi:MAG: hypothetical protein ACR2NZ_18700, partial [Rubripirellula sp.]
MRHRVPKHCCCLPALLLAIFPAAAIAVSPESIQQGKMLFEHQWPSTNPAMGSDGLGPLFNANSCVACHHQGGIGGGGDSRFNAISLGIETVEVTSRGSIRMQRDDVAALFGKFYGGFVLPDNTVNTTAPVHHHGGTPQFSVMRSNLRQLATGLQTREGGPLDAGEVRSVLSQPILFSTNVDADLGTGQAVVRARVFQRNTTPLFGAGLIDAIPAAVIQDQAKLQRRYPEISGRASILQDGTVGRFGWRANVNRLVSFVDQACTNEMGLETKRREQVTDPTMPFYRNPGTDIDDRQIRSMADFISVLPPPEREMPRDEHDRASARRGESVFTKIGCAACHVPNLGPANGLYSDLLLHDMGKGLYDLDAAEPYVLSQKVVTERRKPENRSRSIAISNYYGSPTALDDYIVDSPIPYQIRLTAPRGSYKTSDFISKQKFTDSEIATARQVEAVRQSALTKFDLPSRSSGSYGKSKVSESVKSRLSKSRKNTSLSITDLASKSESVNEFSRRPAPSIGAGRSKSNEHWELGIRRKLSPSETSQEWRTPPLWGLRDS